MPLAGIALSLVAVPVLLNLMSGVAVVNLGFALAILSILGVFAGLPLELTCIALFAVLGLVQGGSFAVVPILNQTAETQALGYGAMAQMAMRAICWAPRFCWRFCGGSMRLGC